MSDILDVVKGRWIPVLKTLGVPDKYLTNANGPCPFCEGTDRFVFTDFEGDGVYLCRGCGNGNGWGFTQKYFKVDFRTAVEMIEPLVGLGRLEEYDAPVKKDPVPALRYIASQVKPVTWNSVGRYLESRGFKSSPEGLKQAKLSYYESGKEVGKYDCLVSLIQDFEGNGVSYHITYTKDGLKADLKNARKVMPCKGSMTGAAVRLDVDFEDKICVAEGIESAYAAGQISGLPAFASLNANNLENFVVPEGVTCVHIYGDNDINYVGQKSAYILAHRLGMKGIEAYVMIPDKFGQDWNDVWNEERKRNE